MKFILMIIVCTSSLFSHTLLLNIVDNKDGSIQIEAAFNTGQTAAGALVKIESLYSGKILLEKRLPDESELKFRIPFEPYSVILDGGRGHRIVKNGPAPHGGFKKEAKMSISNQKRAFKNSNTLPVLWSSACIILLLILFFWIWNSHKLMTMLKNRT